MHAKRRYIRSPKLHLSPADNISLIKQSGLQTSMDHRGVGRIWLCDWDKVGEVMRHLCGVRKVSCLRFACYSVRYWHIVNHLRQSNREGIYYVTADIPANHITLEATMWCDLITKEESRTHTGARMPKVLS